MNKWMQRFFMYLDRYYVKHHSLPPLSKAGLKHFKALIFDEVKVDVTNAMLDLINQERDGAQVDRSLLKNCVLLYEAMGMGCLDAYTMDFEDKLLECTIEYYARKSSEWIESDGTPAYLIKAETAIEAEKARVSQYLNVATEGRLLGVVETEILAKRETVLLEKEGSGLRVLLTNDSHEDLGRMYSLFSKKDEWLVPIANIVKAHIAHMGHECVNRREAKISEAEAAGNKEKNEDADFVKELLALHDKYTLMVEKQFGSNSLFQKALKDAFTDFINRDVGKFTNAELMSSFCDRLLRTGGEKLSDEDTEQFLEKTVQLFSYLVDKDLFAEIYRNQLAKRLLNQRSASDEHEKLVITKLKQRCGSQFTSKMEGMLSDLSIGVDHAVDFKEFYTKKDPTSNLDFSTQMLTTGYWPSYTSYEVNLPPSIQRCVSVFTDYYMEKNSKRRLTWVWGLGGATVRGTWGSKGYDLQVTTLQAIAIMGFNSDNGAPVNGEGFEVIRERLNLPEETVKRILHSLACGKNKVLEKDPKSSSIKPTDTFKPATKFSSKMIKVRIPMASLDESHNAKRVEEDRTVAIEAAVVRIMKARKVLLHQQLVSEVLAQLSFFKPNPKLIKRRIEALIDREYLERDPDVANSYKYLA
eukprot:CAMPEP_0114360526 /NCGR_PEP_ID=MMETSP0101-20121206/23934_1 /TAXON_ID=38822 ORGANISM="Pteridomonas danica, Strain PT" /NCGR_SAMPLE_ID=MMETSP0101 /ASSEMBLY_ACC=CAM_ASM_000211 /LENGTH=638 /DNA_ID=CAMNT_0001504815 /DNA_START=386 /DNA_END=2302 /DNA_ORIENTATION=-